MKKTLILALILLLLVFSGFMLFKSVNMGSLQISGIGNLKAENEKLDMSIQNLSRLSSVDYEQAITNITNSSKQYEKAKSEYEELTTVSTDSEIGAASQLQKYEIEYLWTRIGNHATDENVVLKLEVQANSTSQATGYYDLSFTATGDYVGITDFIYDIENDSSLGFKIENFKMIPGGNSLQATFTCTNIAINIDPSAISRPTNNTNDNNANDNNTNGGNTRNNSGTTNSNTNTTTDRQNGTASQATENLINGNT